MFSDDIIIETIGDVNSTAVGSGARYNAGKAPLHLIPAWIVALHAHIDANDDEDFAPCPDNEAALSILDHLGEWQEHEIPAWSLLRHFDLADIEEAAHVFDYGRKKYSEWNWVRTTAHGAHRVQRDHARAVPRALQRW